MSCTISYTGHANLPGSAVQEVDSLECLNARLIYTECGDAALPLYGSYYILLTKANKRKHKIVPRDSEEFFTSD